MEEVEDEEPHPCNIAPLKKSHIIELNDGSNNSDDDEDGCPPLETVDNEEGSDEEEPLEEPEESAEAELGWLLQSHTLCADQSHHKEQLLKEWNSPVYVFFKLTLFIVYIKEHCVHIFKCAATHCMGKVNGCMVC